MRAHWRTNSACGGDALAAAEPRYLGRGDCCQQVAGTVATAAAWEAGGPHKCWLPPPRLDAAAPADTGEPPSRPALIGWRDDCRLLPAAVWRGSRCSQLLRAAPHACHEMI